MKGDGVKSRIKLALEPPGLASKLQVLTLARRHACDCERQNVVRSWRLRLGLTYSRLHVNGPGQTKSSLSTEQWVST